MYDIELAWDIRCQTGESCVWDRVADRILFCDIQAGVIHHLSRRDAARGSWTLPDQVASFGLCGSGRLVVALRRRVVLFDPASGELATLAEFPAEPAGNRLNDGKVGPDGCFWVGSMDESPERRSIAALYRVRPDGGVERRVEGLAISNGLAWSADGRTMFHSDTPSATIWAWDFDPADGAMRNRRVFAQPDATQGRPDGGATDAAGGYWSAGVSAGRLNHFRGDGQLAESIAMPVPYITMPCFAGEELYVTSLRDRRPAEALAQYPALGGLFRLRPGVAGAPVGSFADT